MKNLAVAYVDKRVSGIFFLAVFDLFLSVNDNVAYLKLFGKAFKDLGFLPIGGVVCNLVIADNVNCIGFFLSVRCEVSRVSRLFTYFVGKNVNAEGGCKNVALCDEVDDAFNVFAIASAFSFFEYAPTCTR